MHHPLLLLLPLLFLSGAQSLTIPKGNAAVAEIQYSPLANDILKAAQHIATAHPDHTPVPPSLIPSSGSIVDWMHGYGDADGYCERLLAPAIRNAQHEVLLTTYVFGRNSRCGKIIHKAIDDLNQRALEQGRTVRVRMVIEMLSSLRGLKNATIPTLPHKEIFGGLHLVPNERFGFTKADQLRGLDMKIKSFHRWIFGAVHSKLLVIDGRDFIAGSKNLDDNIGYEMFVKLRGPIAESSRADFENLWREKLPALDTKDMIDVEASLETRVPMLYLGRKDNPNPFKTKARSPQDVAWLTALAGAKERVFIQTPNFNADYAVEAVLDAVRRNVTVTIITSMHNQDLPEKLYPRSWGDNRGTAHKMYRILYAQDGPAVAENLNLCYFIGNRVKGNPPRPSKNEWTHVKFMSVDDKLTIFGSGNMDPQSWFFSREDNVLVDDPEFTQMTEKALRNAQQSETYCYRDMDGKYLKTDPKWRLELSETIFDDKEDVGDDNEPRFPDAP